MAWENLVFNLILVNLVFSLEVDEAMIYKWKKSGGNIHMNKWWTAGKTNYKLILFHEKYLHLSGESLKGFLHLVCRSF